MCVFLLFSNNFWVSFPVHKPFLRHPEETEQILGALKYLGSVCHLKWSSGGHSWNVGPALWERYWWVFIPHSVPEDCLLATEEWAGAAWATAPLRSLCLMESCCDQSWGSGKEWGTGKGPLRVREGWDRGGRGSAMGRRSEVGCSFGKRSETGNRSDQKCAARHSTKDQGAQVVRGGWCVCFLAI